MCLLKDRVAIVTGASRGIGLAIARIFKRQGAKLVLTAKQNLDNLSEFSEAKIIKFDLSNSYEISLLVEESIRTFGRIDILVNNAAIFKQTDFELISEEELDDIFKVDFRGPFLLTKKVFSQMKKQKKGKIITIVSGAAKLGSAKASHYAAMKAALISLTKSLAKLGGTYNINCNAVAPGFIETEMTALMLSERRDFFESVIPLKRIGKPLDVAGLVLFLSSDKSNYITGQTLCVDGGHCMV